MPSPSHKPDGWGIRLNVFYTTFSIEHRTSLYLPPATRTDAEINTLALEFINALRPLSSNIDVEFYAYSITHSNNFSDPRINLNTPLPGQYVSDTGSPVYKSFTLAMPGRGVEPDLTYKPAPAKVTWFPGRTVYTNPGRLFLYPSEQPVVANVQSGLASTGACTRAGQSVSWYNRLAVQFNAHVQRKIGA